MYYEKINRKTGGSRRCHNGDYNKKCLPCGWRKAYFTLEASLIVPMVLCIIVMLIHLSYYSYQKAILAQDLYLLGFRVAVLGRQQEVEADAYVQSNAAEQFGNRYIGSAPPRIETIDNSRLIKLSADTEADHEAMSGYFLMPVSSWRVAAASKADVIHRGKHIRRINRIVDLGKITLINGRK